MKIYSRNIVYIDDGGGGFIFHVMVPFTMWKAICATAVQQV